MPISSYPASLIKRNIVTLTSGSSWTVPSGVTNIVVTLIGAGGGGTAGANNPGQGSFGQPGQRIASTVTTTPGASISYSLGAGGTAGGGTGGTTTFTGATSATGGLGASQNGYAGTTASGYPNGGGNSASGTGTSGGAGGAGSIEIEYWSN